MDTYVDALGHRWNEGEVTTAPTCTEAGVKTFTCTVCGETRTEAVDALGHDYQAVVTAPTCTAQGYTTHTCTRCDDSYVDTYVDALGHNWNEGEVTTAPSCTEAGVKTFTCTVCGETRTEPVEALGHDYKAVVTAPTCTEQGYTTHTCSRCNESYVDTYVDTLGHAWGEPDWDWNGTESATATFTCTRDASHTHSETASGSAISSAAGTGADAGYTVYTASVTFEGSTYTNTIRGEAIAYTIAYDLAGGTGATGNPESYTVESEAITLTEPTREGYAFAGWTGTDLNEATKTVTIAKGSTGDRTYTATWDPIVTFKANFTGENIPADVTQTVPNNTATALTAFENAETHAKMFAREGFTFAGWNTAADGTGTAYTDGQQITITEPLTLYAQWETAAERFTHSDNFSNTNFIYRVGNGNTVKLGSIFAEKEATRGDTIDPASVIITVVPHSDSSVSAAPTYAKHTTDWAQSTLQFTGTGPITITIQEGESGTPYTMDLEIVNARNVTAYSELTSSSCVLLNDITMSSGGQKSLSNGTWYGNGFTFDVKNGKHGNTSNGTDSGNYVISISNATLDNIQIVGAVYTDYGATAKADYNFPCVLVNGGNCEIVNSYISNCASPVRVRGGANLYFENTMLKGGSFCNLDVRSGCHITVNGLTTINQVSSNDAADNGTVIIGLGIVFYYEGMSGIETLRITGNGLTQFNSLAENQEGNAVSLANKAYSRMFDIDSKFVFNDGSTKWVNSGILSLSTIVNSNNIDTPDGYGWESVNMSPLGSGYLCTSMASSQQSSPDYSSNAQHAIAPIYSFEYPTGSGKKNYQAKTEGSNDYCYWDTSTNSIAVSFSQGGSKEFDPDIITITKNGHSITPTVSFDGGAYQAISTKITISTEGEHTLTYKYVDPYNYRYDQNGSVVGTYEATYTKTVQVNVTVAIASIDPATFDFNGKGYKTVTANNVTYVMPDVDATATNSIGSTTKGGKTVYYPIVWSKNSSATSNASSAPVLCPIFVGVVTITDRDLNNDPVVYGSGTTTMADGHLVAISDVTTGSSFLSWNNGATPPSDNPKVVNGNLYYQSVTISGVERAQTVYTCEYAYTDTAGNTYHYFVGYIFPKLEKTCFATGTLITLADGTQKAIEELTNDDLIMSFDHTTGQYCGRPVAAIVNHGEDEYDVLELQFSDSTKLKIIGDHGLYDLTLQKYVNINQFNYVDYVGHQFARYSSNNSHAFAELTSGRVVTEFTGSWSIWSSGNMNHVINSMLGVTTGINGEFVDGFNLFDFDEEMKYDVEKMVDDIQKYGVYSYEEWADLVDRESFEKFNIQYFKVAVGKGYLTKEQIVDYINWYYHFIETGELVQ